MQLFERGLSLMGENREGERGEVCKGRGNESHACVCVVGGARAGGGGSGRCEPDDVRCARRLLSAESLSAVLRAKV